MRAPSISCFLFAFFFILSIITAQPRYFPTANLSTTWTNHESSIPSINFTDGSRIRVVLLRENAGLKCGFFCNGSCTSYLFAILIDSNIKETPEQFKTANPVVIWSANRNYPVREGAILKLTAPGELVLRDFNGSIVWTTKTTGRSSVGMNLTEEGNLVLFDGHKSMVWQSFDHPTDCLVPGQKLRPGQKLIPSVSPTNYWTSQKDLYSLEVTEKGLFAYVESNIPQVYYRYLVAGTNTNEKIKTYLQFVNRSPAYIIFQIAGSDVSVAFNCSVGNTCTSTKRTEISVQCSTVGNGTCTTYRKVDHYIKLMPDGHLKAFEFKQFQWTEVADLLTDDDLGECSYPLFCGRNAICSNKNQCSCPEDSFRLVNYLQPMEGCSRVTNLTCNSTQDQDFIQLKNVTHISYNTTDMENVSMETCNKTCLNRCSCEAALFKYSSNSSRGDCYLASELLTMRSAEVHLNASVFIKVQNVRSTPSSTSQSSGPLPPPPEPLPPGPLPNRKNHVLIVLGSVAGSTVVLLIAALGFTNFIIQKQKTNSEVEEEYLDQILCGRKNVDRSQPEESWHLLHVFQSCWEQGTLLSIVDKYSEDMQVHATEVMEMMKVAAWCLQTDYMKRPSMSTVMKVLEGVMNVESNLDYNFLDPRMQRTIIEREKSSKPLLPSILSGPR
ncbi:hypothetical protein L2E82_07972 [Cichorium intybus]|uniref:Uncharacterized protein n=1 Tax=Cichorium intybus TaxID=13427 RepID=A0ACB9G6B0_CICIN|nr:hypothetical protein L2E82_07972 [Cichorium intybus]